MPLNLPDKLPAIELLKEENIFVIDTSRATQQDIRPLRIVILNLMPLKITTETDLVRLLSNTPLQVEISFMKIKSHTSKNTPIEHIETIIKTTEDGVERFQYPMFKDNEHLLFQRIFRNSIMMIQSGLRSPAYI